MLYACIYTHINFVIFSAEDRQELCHDWQAACQSVEEWKSHIVRAIRQDLAKSDILQNLTERQVLVIMD